MKGTKKIIMGATVLLAIGAVGVGLYLQKKKNDSKALAQYIPPSAYVARINTTKALKLAYALKKDTFNLPSNSRWKALFNDSLSTGIDFLVNPWIFGDSTNVNVAFQLQSVSKFVKWMKGVSDSAFLVNKVQAFHIKEKKRSITFFTNGSKVALASLAPLPNSVKTAKAFYNAQKGKSKMLNTNESLLSVRLNKPLQMGDFIELKDSILKLNIEEREISLNRQNAVSANKTFSVGVRLNSDKWNRLKEYNGIKEAFKILGLSKLQISGTPFLQVYVQDTFHKHVKSYSYEFDDNFEKVKVEKVSTKVLPNIGVRFTFGSKEGQETFIKNNKLSNYSHDFLQLYVEEKGLRFGMKKAEALPIMHEHFILNMQKFRQTLAWNRQFAKMDLKPFKGIVELVYTNHPQKGTYLRIETEQHPVFWLLGRVRGKEAQY